MILRTTESLDDTAEQTWRLRRLWAGITATVRRALLLRTYEDEALDSPTDRGDKCADVERTGGAQKRVPLLMRRYDLERAWDIRTRPASSNR
ncbi:MAG: hypothetical protein AAGF49_01765 [Pseudomonadota bacterium]